MAVQKFMMSTFGLCSNLGFSVTSATRKRLVDATYMRNRLNTGICQSKCFGTGSGDGDDDDYDGTAPLAGKLSLFSRGAARFGRRPLSPLERVSQMVPQESLSEEVWELRGDKPREEELEASPPNIEDLHEPLDESGAAVTQSKADQSVQTQPEEHVLKFGELLLAEYRRKRRLEFQKMFHLEKGMKLHSNWGVIAHEAMEGCYAGTTLRTSLGLPILIRRPSLEEFTLFMKRGPAIAYPKDASAMLLMMDVNEGDCVLESGSGSGAMSLFLSRAVGCRGSVLSVEMRQDHHRRAGLNYQRWRSSWKTRTGDTWPDNVHFHHADLINSAPLLAGQSFNSIALDMVNPQLALPIVVPHLHNGGVCAVYLANITQIIDLMEGLRCTALPLVCERIIEVQYRDWLLAPSLKKDGSFNQRKAPGEGIAENEDGDVNEDQVGLESLKSFPFGSVPYIARPHPEQFGHTAFLVKLRKISK